MARLPASTGEFLFRGSPAEVSAQIRRALKAGGSAEHAAGVQWFFKDEVESHGWYTAELRRAARGFRRELRKERGLDFLVGVADHLFSGPVLEEKAAAVFLLDRISSWADHDGLVHSLIAPMIASDARRAKHVFVWAKSPNRWHRRAACVALIRGARARMFFAQITKLSDSLLADEDDMVQKGLGWLLRETAKSDAKKTVPY